MGDNNCWSPRVPLKASGADEHCVYAEFACVRVLFNHHLPLLPSRRVTRYLPMWSKVQLLWSGGLTANTSKDIPRCFRKVFDTNSELFFSNGWIPYLWCKTLPPSHLDKFSGRWRRNSSDPSDRLWVGSKRNRTDHGSCHYKRHGKKSPALGSPLCGFYSSTVRWRWETVGKPPWLKAVFHYL